MAEHRERVGKIVGMHHVDDGLSDEILIEIPDDIAQLFISTQATALRVEVSDSDGRILEGATESLLTLLQGPFGVQLPACPFPHANLPAENEPHWCRRCPPEVACSLGQEPTSGASANCPTP